MSARSVAARYVWTDGEWKQNVAFDLGADGHIERVRAARPDERAEACVLPGLHNAHSHAFQWAMRGATQCLSPGHESDDFWSWREHMYGLAATVTPEQMFKIAREAYTAMRAAGYVSVGEFHYLHHADGERPAAMAAALADAAQRAGLPITLIPVAYHRGGHNRPAAGAQLRFCFDDPAAFLRYVDQLRAELAGPNVGVAVGVHSVRAVPRDWIRPIADYATAHAAPFHIHVCEQRAEIRECVGEHGLAPIALLEAEGALNERTVLVHATHLEAGDIEAIAARRAIVCACPSTEADLGDGFLEAKKMLDASVRVCIGSDSHIVVDPAEELAMLERRARLRHERRNVLTTADCLRPADALMRWGAEVGAAANGLGSGRLAVGERFDALELPLVSADPASSLDHWLFARPTPGPARVWTEGR